MNEINPNIEIKIPVVLPIIIVTIFFVLIARIYVLNLNNKVEALSVTQSENEEQIEVIETEVIDEGGNEKIEETENVVDEEETELLETDEEEKTATYTASNGKQYEVIATLNIPSLGIEYPILSSTSEALLKVALNKYWGANPNEVGNMVVLGHNYKNSKFFGKLPQIQKGAIVKITDLSGKTLDYKVYETCIIDPDDNSCTSQLTNGQTEITLITCYYELGDVHASKRFVVKARAI